MGPCHITVVTHDAAKLELLMLNALIGDGEEMDVVVDPRDEMLLFLANEVGAQRARFDYLRLGHELLRTVEQITDWGFPGERESISIMEFACGYGRNVRHLVRRFPENNLTVSDVDPEAVAFVTERFGVNGKLSDAEPERLCWDERYDLIIVPSLFSHLPDATFSRWLRFLHGLLTERGVLAFSVHDAHLLPDRDLHRDGQWAGGILFSAHSEAASRLDTKQYGTSFVTEAYVADQIETATGARSYGRVPRGFWDFQDVYLTSGPRQHDPSSLRCEPPIMGHVDTVEFAAGQVSVSGWARATQPGLTLRIRVGDSVLHESRRFDVRPDVAHVRGPEFMESGFAVTLDVAPAGPDSQLLVVDATAGDLTTCFYALPIHEQEHSNLGDTARKRRRAALRRIRTAAKALVNG